VSASSDSASRPSLGQVVRSVPVGLLFVAVVRTLEQHVWGHPAGCDCAGGVQRRRNDEQAPLQSDHHCDTDDCQHPERRQQDEPQANGATVTTVRRSRSLPNTWCARERGCLVSMCQIQVLLWSSSFYESPLSVRRSCMCTPRSRVSRSPKESLSFQSRIATRNTVPVVRTVSFDCVDVSVHRGLSRRRGHLVPSLMCSVCTPVYVARFHGLVELLSSGGYSALLRGADGKRGSVSDFAVGPSASKPLIYLPSYEQ
jgi:hypothetical protein